ncbi:MAG: hypothetical protein V4735_09775 [Pseudomonadota bacterium]
MDEQQRENDRKNFVRLAEKRVTKALNTIRLIGNLSNTSNYYYTARDVEKIFATLAAEIEECKKKFEAKQKTKPTFSLDDDGSDLC